jgi:hypothetical protein
MGFVAASRWLVGQRIVCDRFADRLNTRRRGAVVP